VTANNTYWIADPEGVKAVVTGAAERDFWVRVRGYTEAPEATGQELTWVRNDNHGGYGQLNAEAARLLAGLGWRPSGPPPVPGMPETAPETPPETPDVAPAETVPTATGGTEQE